MKMAPQCNTVTCHRVDFTHLSKAALQSHKHKLCFFLLHSLQLLWFGSVRLARGWNRCVICLLLKMFTYKLSYLLSRKQEACHTLKICGAPSVAAQFWKQKRYLGEISHWQVRTVEI